MQALALGIRERLRPREQCAGSRVAVRHRVLLLVRQGEDAQCQHLVDLGRVEEIARALGRHLRVIGEDDWRT